MGAILGKDNRSGRLFVREAPSGLAAAQAGIAEGDELTQIDGKAVAAMSADEIHRALSGKVGSKVTLTLVHEGRVRVVAVERGPLQPGHPPTDDDPAARGK